MRKQILLSAAIALLWVGSSGSSGEAWAQTARPVVAEAAPDAGTAPPAQEPQAAPAAAAPGVAAAPAGQATVQCGDMICEGDETAQSCPDDCGELSAPSAATPPSGGGTLPSPVGDGTPPTPPGGGVVPPPAAPSDGSVGAPPGGIPSAPSLTELWKPGECEDKQEKANPFFPNMSKANRAAILLGVVLFLYVVFAWLFFKTMLERGAPIARTYGLTVSMILFLSYAMAFLCFFEMSFGPDWCVGLNVDEWQSQMQAQGPFAFFNMGQGWIWIAGLVVVGGVSWMLSMMPAARTSRARNEEAS